VVRAEPIAALFEHGRAHLCGTFGALEDELTSYDGTGASPNRLDALVWAVTELRIGGGIGVY
jgi:phage terminase large subunit-like protein